MKADLTRNSFDRAKNFSRVLMQQGRVQLDADWNEQADILLYLIRRLTLDLGGQAWSPDSGFIPQALTTAQPVPGDVIIPAGSFYVDGILCEIDATPVAILKWDQPNTVITVAQWTVDDLSFAKDQYLQLSDDSGTVSEVVICKIVKIHYADMTLTVDNFGTGALVNAEAGRARRLVTYLGQPNLAPVPALPATGATQLYLDVWERLITSVEDDSIREVALNGVDTAARAKVVWQVKAYTLPSATRKKGDQNISCMTSLQLGTLMQGWNRGLLRARVEPAGNATDPCTIAPASGYRGPENQLYRVEIHTGGAIAANAANTASAQPSFKWSRENGAVVFPVQNVAGSGPVTVTLASLGRDSRFGLTEGNWVELQNDQTVLGNIVSPLLQVQSINRAAQQVTLTGSPPALFSTEPGLHPLLRRWDQIAGDPAAGGLALNADGTAPVQGALWLDLEDGVQVLFFEADEATYRTGDYWLIPARVATGNVVWPTEIGTDGAINQVAKPPDGIDHHFAPLAIIQPGTGANGGNAPQITSCYPGRLVQTNKG